MPTLNKMIINAEEQKQIPFYLEGICAYLYIDTPFIGENHYDKIIRRFYTLLHHKVESWEARQGFLLGNYYAKKFHILKKIIFQMSEGCYDQQIVMPDRPKDLEITCIEQLIEELEQLLMETLNAHKTGQDVTPATIEKILHIPMELAVFLKHRLGTDSKFTEDDHVFVQKRQSAHRTKERCQEWRNRISQQVLRMAPKPQKDV